MEERTTEYPDPKHRSMMNISTATETLAANNRLQIQLSFAEQHLPEGITGYEIARESWCHFHEEALWTLRAIRSGGRTSPTVLLLVRELELMGALRALAFIGA